MFSRSLEEVFLSEVSKKLKNLLEDGAGVQQYTLTRLSTGSTAFIVDAITNLPNTAETEAKIDNIVLKATDHMENVVGSSFTEALFSESKNAVRQNIQKKGKVKGRGGFLDASGKPISGLRLTALLNSMVKIKAAEIMQNQSNNVTLRYRTGRLARSAEITSVDLRSKSIYFSYMMNPYAVFEPGGAMHLKGRSPTNIFGHAIAESLAVLLKGDSFVTNKFKLFRNEYYAGDVIGGLFGER